MRRTAFLLNLLVVLSLVLSACVAATPSGGAPAAESGAAAATEAPAAEAPAAGGEVSREDTLIFAADLTDLISLDPAVAYEFSGIQAEGSTYETLVSFDPGNPELKPLLAESWEIKADGDMNVITFKLNPSAKFASGNPVTADDVLYSWSRAIDINKSPAFLFTDVAQLTKENMKAVDASTFEVRLPNTVSPQVFLSVISFTIAAVVEKAVLEANAGDDMGSTWLNDNSAGSGPYVLSKWDRSVSVTLDANPNYWGTAPKLKRVIMQNIPELANLQAAIETGDADIVQDLSAEQAKQLEGNADIGLVHAQGSQIAYLGMNATKPPLDNPDVREAIRYAINYDDILTLLGGNGSIHQEIIPEGFLGFQNANPFSQDIDKAKELLAKAGVAEGTEIEFLVPTGTGPGGIEQSALSAKIQDDVSKIGLKLNIKQLETSELLNIYRAQGAQIVLISWGPDFPDPDGNATPFSNWDAHSLAWRNDWNNADAIALSKQAAVEPDSAKRVELYKQLTELVLHQGPYAMLYQPGRIFGVRSNIDGFIYDAQDTPSITFAAIGKK
ncbi:MAG: ABC transporter substrate-binding protein [Caldilineaceae bacterium]